MIERHTIIDCSKDLFKAYDNLEFGILSKAVELPEDLRFLIDQEYLSISDKW